MNKFGYMTRTMILAGAILAAIPTAVYADQTVTGGQAAVESNSEIVRIPEGPGIPMVEEPAVPVMSESESRRKNLVNFAMQFVGGPYRYGGSDPRTGVDCSGFTRYVMLHGAGVSLNRSSGAQANQGVSVSAEQMRPGDLIFYASGRSINHVAMYIGNGQIVHASTYETGIKTSVWNYRTPVKIMNVMGD